MNNTTKFGKYYFLFFIVIFLIIGVYNLLIGLIPIKIEIKFTDEHFIATIQKTNILPPFKKETLYIDNLKQAIITKRTFKGTQRYRVELQSMEGTTTPLTDYYSSNYKSKEKLQNQINQAIENKTNYTYTIIQFFKILLGLIFIIVTSYVFYIFKTVTKNPNKKENPLIY